MRGAWIGRQCARPAARDSGSLTLVLSVLMTALLAMSGLVIDGGRKLNQSAEAYAIAQEAARAGAGMVDRSAAYRSGTFQVDEGEALAAARAYLAGRGDVGSVTTDGPRRIQVTVTITSRTLVLSLVGVDTMSSAGSAVASLVTGVTGAGA